MTFEISAGKLPNEAELMFVKVLYFDGYYELMGYLKYDKRDWIGHEIKSDFIDKLKNSLMDIFAKLQNEEIRIFRKYGADVRGKLNWRNFCDTEGSLRIG